MNLYMKTTTDKYELPIAVEDSPAKLAKRLGLKRHSVATLCSKQICGYHRIRMEDDDVYMTENEIVREYRSAKDNMERFSVWSFKAYEQSRELSWRTFEDRSPSKW